MRLKYTPIRRKLMGVMLLTCSLVLTLMCSAYVFFEFFTLRDIVKNNVATLGLVIASNSSGALAFDSEKDADEILNALKADQHIVAACLYDKDGHIFAKYPLGANKSMFPPQPLQNGYRFEKTYLEGFQPVMQKNERLGTLYIKSDLDAMYAQLKQYGFIALFLIAVSLFVAFLLSSLLQKIISKPVVALKQTAVVISEQHDYSVRAVKQSNDEMGELTDAFNQMLAQIEAQTHEIKQAEEENAKLAAIVESSDDAIIGKTLDGIITSWNDAAERIFGYNADEMIGQSVLKLVPQELWDQEPLLLERLRNGERVGLLETQRVTKGSRVIDVSLTVSPVKDILGQITGISKIARDISGRKKIERQIVKSEEHLRLATQAAELGTFDIDVLNHTMDWDKRCRELFGIYHDEPLTYDDHFINNMHPEDRDGIIKELQKALYKTGNEGNYDLEYRTIGLEDKKLRWVRTMGKVFFDDDDKPLRMIGAVLDITDKKQEEIRKNDFIAIVSHELKTPLTSIKSYLQVLLGLARKEGDSFRINALTRADAQTNKMAAMIQDFLSLARLEEGKMQINKSVFELAGLIEDVVAEARFLTTGHTIIVKDCDEIKINGDRDKIGHVLINLLSNAIKYSPKNTTITIGCEKSSGKVKVFVSDEGIGINIKDQKKLFDRFYRVNNERMKTVSGFGIGLYIVAEILRYHNSKIEVSSTEGEGSNFYFYIALSK